MEIPGRKNIYESEGNTKICYTIDEIDANGCHFYYEKKDGTETMKCIPSGTCKQNGFDYVFEKECRKNCSDYYKLMDESSDATINTIRCFETLDKALEYEVNVDTDNTKKIKFYNMQLKQCWFDYHDYLFILYENLGINNDLYEVVQKCESYYY